MRAYSAPLTRDDVKLIAGVMMPHLDERQRRFLYGALATVVGHGGVAEISDICGVSSVTVSKAKAEVRDMDKDPTAKPALGKPGKVRAPGAGRPGIESTYPDVKDVLYRMLDGNTCGDPQSLLTWTCKGLRNLSDSLRE